MSTHQESRIRLTNSLLFRALLYLGVSVFLVSLLSIAIFYQRQNALLEERIMRPDTACSRRWSPTQLSQSARGSANPSSMSLTIFPALMRWMMRHSTTALA